MRSRTRSRRWITRERRRRPDRWCDGCRNAGTTSLVWPPESQARRGRYLMKALALSSFDEEPSVMEVEDPVPGTGEVLVRVAAASVNAFDVRVASGGVRAFMTYEFPAVIGGDLS